MLERIHEFPHKDNLGEHLSVLERLDSLQAWDSSQEPRGKLNRQSG